MLTTECTIVGFLERADKEVMSDDEVAETIKLVEKLIIETEIATCVGVSLKELLQVWFTKKRYVAALNSFNAYLQKRYSIA